MSTLDSIDLDGVSDPSFFDTLHDALNCVAKAHYKSDEEVDVGSFVALATYETFRHLVDELALTDATEEWAAYQVDRAMHGLHEGPFMHVEWASFVHDNPIQVLYKAFCDEDAFQWLQEYATTCDGKRARMIANAPSPHDCWLHLFRTFHDWYVS